MYVSSKDLHDNELKVRLTDAQIQALRARAALFDIPPAVMARMLIIQSLMERNCVLSGEGLSEAGD